MRISFTVRQLALFQTEKTNSVEPKEMINLPWYRSNAVRYEIVRNCIGGFRGKILVLRAMNVLQLHSMELERGHLLRILMN